MKIQRPEREELIAIVGAALLAIGVFMAWYTLNNRNAVLGTFHYPTDKEVTAWDALTFTRYMLVAAAAAPVILTLLVIIKADLSWPRGEVTSVIALFALTVVIVRGLIIRPGLPPGQIGLGTGYWISLAGAVLMAGGAMYHRARHDDTDQKPPGVL